jgi:putative transcriptional regulator
VQLNSTAGRLLVANPLLVDPNFARTVVLMIEHDDDGALGLVLNRPSETPVGEIIDQWAPMAAEPDVFFIGGPVSPDSVIGLGRLAEPGAPARGRRVVGDIATVDLDEDPATAPFAAVRLFAGYAGWGPGQLDDELGLQGWLVVGARPGDALDPDPATVWRRVIARQPGSTSWLATFPEDLAVN